MSTNMNLSSNGIEQPVAKAPGGMLYAARATKDSVGTRTTPFSQRWEAVSHCRKLMKLGYTNAEVLRWNGVEYAVDVQGMNDLYKEGTTEHAPVNDNTILAIDDISSLVVSMKRRVGKGVSDTELNDFAAKIVRHLVEAGVDPATIRAALKGEHASTNA